MKKFIEKIKQRLKRERAASEEELSTFAKKDPVLKGDWDTQLPDIGAELTDDSLEDQAKEREEYERLLPVEHVLENKLQKIESALGKIEKGKYGVCEKCGKKISQQRLLAIPETKLCIECQKKVEEQG
jgi:DnaK suppressor protein